MCEEGGNIFYKNINKRDPRTGPGDCRSPECMCWCCIPADRTASGHNIFDDNVGISRAFESLDEHGRGIQWDSVPSDEQKGGAYRYIVNPKTGRKVHVNGIIGRKVLNNYLSQFE